MRTLLVLVTLMGTLETTAAGVLAADPQTMTLSWELLTVARYGQDTREHAAFLVRGENGDLHLVHWPFGAEQRKATYRGTMPAGTVAILHTHPSHLPGPSRGDERLAKRLGLPVYVLTRNRITRTDGSRMVLVAVGDWKPSR